MTETDTYHGRRLRCNSCGERLSQSARYESVAEHAQQCESTVSHPYHPDRVHEGTQTDVTAYGEEVPADD